MLRIGWVLALGLAACGADDGGGSTAADAAAVVHDPPEGDAYRAGLEKAGAEGLATVRLVDALPAPPDRGDNRWVLEIEAGGAMMTGCAVAVVPDMPLHGHGTEPVTVRELGEGRYQVSEMSLFMPGLWVIPIAVTCGEMSDTATFEFWIEG